MIDVTFICPLDRLPHAAQFLGSICDDGSPEFAKARWHNAQAQPFACATGQLAYETLDALRHGDQTPPDCTVKVIEPEDMHLGGWASAAIPDVTVVAGMSGVVALALLGLRPSDSYHLEF